MTTTPNFDPTRDSHFDTHHCCQFLEFTDELAYVLDPRDCLLYCNRSAADRLQIADQAPNPSRNWIDHVHEDDRGVLHEALRRVRQEGAEVCSIDVRMVGRLGALTRTRHRLRLLDSENGRDGYVIGIAQDVTELRRLEDQLHQSQKLETIGMLAGGIAHDFNNMLAAILGYTELMIEERTPEDPDFRALNYIQASTERAAALVKQLLIFSRKSGFEQKTVRLGALIRETLDMLERTLPKTIRIHVTAEEEADTVMGDPGRIQQALMNLCLNARDAMPEGGDLHISVERATVSPYEAAEREGARSGEFLKISVRDTGSGMPPEVVERIWEAFYTTKPSGEGTGLGLAVVHNILRMHQGHAKVESDLGEGTTFSLYLPAASVPQIAGSASLREPDGGSETILIVDDEPVLLDLLFDILHSKGYHVLAANTTEDALEFVDHIGDRIDLVISDNMMPGMTGRVLTQEIKQRHPRTKILVCSGFNPTRESEIAEMDYVPTYIQKPYQRKELLKRVRDVLDAAREGPHEAAGVPGAH